MYISVNQTFIDVVNDLLDTMGQEYSFEDPKGQPAGLQLEIEDVSFLIVHVPASDAEHFSVICKLGPLPKNREEAMRRALELNTATTVSKGAVFGMDLYDQVMTANLRVGVCEVDGPALLASLSMLVQLAKQWRRDPLAGKPKPPVDSKKFPSIKGAR